MATVNTIKTRILNKYDLFENYKDNFIPYKGEICIVEIPTTESESGLTPPAIGIKVGDGDRPFSELNWIQAIAGDVAVGLKELTGVADIDTKIAALTSGRKLATVAELIALSEELGAVKDTVNHAEHGNTALKSAIDTLSSNTTTNLATKVDKSVAEEATSTDKLVKKSTVTADINTAIKDVQTNLNTLAGEGNTATVKGNAEAISGINTKIGDEAIGDKTVTKAIADLQASVGNSSEGLGSQVAGLKTDLTELQGRVTTVENDLNTATTGLKAKVTALEGEMDVVQAATAGFNASSTIAAKFATIEETIGGVSSKANTNEAAIAVLNGDKSTSGSVAHTAAAAVAEIVAGADTNFDTLKEIADWIKSDTTGAAEMANDIAEMQGLLGVVEGEVLPATVDARIEAAITGANLGQYATAEALGGVANRVKAIEDAPYATTANVATAKNEVIGASGDAKTANTIYGAKAYADDAAATAKSGAISAAASAADAKYELKDVAKGLVEALAGAGNTTTVKKNADEIGRIDSAIKGMDFTDTVNGVVTKVDQADGKISVTHKKITMDEFDPDAIFIFDCGNASRDA